MKTLDALGNMLIQNKRNLAIKIDEIRASNGETVSDITDEVINLRSSLFQYFGEAMHTDEKTSVQNFKEWGIKSGELAVKYDIPLDQALESTRYYRVVLWEFIKEQAENLLLDAMEVIKLASIIDPLLDQTVHSFSVAYVEYNNRILGLAREAIEELSVPVVRLTSSLAILPLVGTIDTYRSKLIMDTSLQKCMEYQVERLFIDLSGVPVIDTMVAHNLFQVINSLKLLGVKVTLSGMRPELSQTVVSLGISFEGISIVGSLHQELEKIGISH